MDDELKTLMFNLDFFNQKRDLLKNKIGNQNKLYENIYNLKKFDSYVDHLLIKIRDYKINKILNL